MEPTEIQVPQSEETQQTEKRAKPPLTVEQQLVHLKAKGVTFDLCNEEEAATYLSDKCQFFRVIAYRKLFDKHVGGERDGQYINLDFAQLRYLAGNRPPVQGRDARYVSRHRALREGPIAARANLARGRGWLLRGRRLPRRTKVKRTNVHGERAEGRKGDDYCGDIIQKYADGMPLWALLEVVSFGTLIGMIKFCADRWGDPRPQRAPLSAQARKVHSQRNRAFLLLPQRHRRQEAGEHPRSVGYFEGTFADEPA